MVLDGNWEEGEMGNYCLIGVEFQFYKMKKVIEVDGGDSWIPF